jgi:hypothetical protein
MIPRWKTTDHHLDFERTKFDPNIQWDKKQPPLPQES